MSIRQSATRSLRVARLRNDLTLCLESTTSPARRAAFQVLLRVETRDSYAAELLHSELLKDLSALDRALATEVVMGTLRWQSLLDSRLTAAASLAMAKMDAEVRVALRLAAYQLFYLDKVPARAAVHESVELVKRSGKRSAAGFANAVLRKLAEGPIPTLTIDLKSPAAMLAAKYAHPEWLVERWINNYGGERAELICAVDQERPVTAIRFDAPEVEERLVREGIELEAGKVVAGARRVIKGDVTQSTAWREHEVFIQDEASQLVALLLGRSRKILDCCAAPGGKAAGLAARNRNSFIVASELHLHRARKMKELIGGQGVHIIAADAQRLPFRMRFDRVLADLPCSGTGTLARNPEIKWKLKTADLADLAERQRNILQAAMLQVTPGGRIVYSTCSLEREEGEAVIVNAIQNGAFRIVPMREELLKLQAEGEVSFDVESLVSGEFLRTIPGVHPCDGFFAAVLERI
jgi:16S rRNA (cytosine967-C5)-methyltransferase